MKILTWGIYLVIFCLPLYLVRFTLLDVYYLTGFKIFGIPTTVLEVMIYVLFIIWLIKGFKFSEFKKLLITHHLLLITIVLIFIGVSLATVFSSDLRTSAGIWKAWFIDPILFFIVLITTVKTSSQVKKVLGSLFLSGVVVSVISLIYLIQGKLDATGRLQAFYNSPNYLAMYLVPALIIGLGYYLFAFFARPSPAPRFLWCRVSEARSRMSPSLSSRSCGTNHARFGLITRKNIILNTPVLLSVVCLLLSIFFTHSYGAWLGVVVAIGFELVFYLYKLKRKKLVWIIVCFGLIAILGLGYLKFHQPMADQSLSARLLIWQKAFEIFKTNPILGIGPGTFGNYFPPYPRWGVPQPHNIFLAFLLQTGIIGFIGFILLLIYFFKTGLNLLNTHYSILITILISIMVYILVHGLVDTTYWKNDLAVVFWGIVGLMVALGNLSRNEISCIENRNW